MKLWGYFKSKSEHILLRGQQAYCNPAQSIPLFPAFLSSNSKLWGDSRLKLPTFTQFHKSTITTNPFTREFRTYYISGKDATQNEQLNLIIGGINKAQFLRVQKQKARSLWGSQGALQLTY